jgi:hypothetical protein
MREKRSDRRKDHRNRVSKFLKFHWLRFSRQRVTKDAGLSYFFVTEDADARRSGANLNAPG